jgi:hypothetical protein
MSLSSHNITGYNDTVSSTLIAAATHIFTGQTTTEAYDVIVGTATNRHSKTTSLAPTNKQTKTLDITAQLCVRANGRQQHPDLILCNECALHVHTGEQTRGR